MTGLLGREARAGPSALQQSLSATPRGQIYLRVAAAASPSHGLCRPPLSGRSRLSRRGLQSEAGARPRGARGHTPLRRETPPPSGSPCVSRDAKRRSYWARARRSAGQLPAPVAFPSRESRKGCALRNAPLVPLPAGVAGIGEAHSTPGAWSPSSLSGCPRPAAPEWWPAAPEWSPAAGPGRGRCARLVRLPSPAPPPFPTYRAAGRYAGSLGWNAWCIFLRAGLGCLR